MKKVQEWDVKAAEGVEIDNRARLNDYFNEQQVERSKNVVTKLGKNFDSSGVQNPTRQNEFNGAWFGQNKLEQRDLAQPMRPGIATATPENPSQRFSRSGKVSGGKGIKENVADQPSDSKEAVPQVAQGKFADQLKMQLDREESGNQKGGGQKGDGEQGRNLRNYQQRLDESFDQQQAQRQQLGNNSQGNGQGQPNAPQGGPAGFNGGGGGGLGGARLQNGTQFGSALNGPMPQDPNAPLRQPTTNDLAQQVDGTPTGRLMQLAQATSNGRGQFAPLNSSWSSTAPSLGLPSLPGGMASLDVALPMRGKVYYFKEVRGATQVTGRAFDKETMYRGISLLVTLVISAIIVLILRNANFSRLGGMSDSLAVDLVVTALALLAFLASMLPWLALIVLVIGLVRLSARFVGYMLRRKAA